MTSTRAIPGVSLFLASLLVAFAGFAADSGEELRTAALDGDLAAVERLLAAGVEADSADRWDMTALSFAAQEGHTAVVRLLLSHGANPDQRESFFGSTPPCASTSCLLVRP